LWLAKLLKTPMVQRSARPQHLRHLIGGAGAMMMLHTCNLPAQSHPQPAVVPSEERLNRGQQVTVTQGVLEVKRLGGQPLGPDFPALAGRELRLRQITIAPGGSIGLHLHDQRPGVAYILEGQMTERRGPGFAPQVIGIGEAAFEGSGISHWWRNEGSTPARALVVDIVPVETP
jgi:quercetin dioxygenase-like cupin family protein